MRIISMAKLRDFWAEHPDAEDGLRAWYKVTEQAEWADPLNVRDTYRTADPIGDEFMIFNIVHNRYRLAVRIDYRRQIVYVWGVYTHAEYDRIDFRSIDEKIRRESQQKRKSDREG